MLTITKNGTLLRAYFHQGKEDEFSGMTSRRRENSCESVSSTTFWQDEDVGYHFGDGIGGKEAVMRRKKRKAKQGELLGEDVRGS